MAQLVVAVWHNEDKSQPWPFAHNNNIRMRTTMTATTMQ
jgi:hypothetical protein